MKKLSLLLFCVIISGGAAAHDGTVNISGSINANTCIISPETQEQTVSLGNIASKQFTEKGDTSPPVAFTIDVQNCSSSVSSLTLNFQGTADTNDNTLLALDGSNPAQGVAISLLDADDNPVPLNTTTRAYAIDPSKTDNVLTFYAQYMATTDKVSGGDANATVTFDVTWQ
ncbi:TPA: fimbrial protein [Enterobacter cancerogenus]